MARLYKRTLVAASAVAAMGALAALMTHASTGRPSGIEAPSEPLMLTAASRTGGTVAEVLVRPGERVSAGQVLLRFDSTALRDQRAALVSALEASRAMAAIPQSALPLLIGAHPDVRAAEDRYVRALSAIDAAAPDRRSAALRDLDRAAQGRTEVRRRVGEWFSRSGSRGARASTARIVETCLRELDRAMADLDVRAPVAAIVDILDVRPGDRIAPGFPAALLSVPGEYFSEFAVAPREVAGLRQGMSSQAVLPGGVRVSWRVDSIAQRRLPVALRSDRQDAEQTFVRARFSTAAPLPPGTAVEFTMPRPRRPS